MIAPESRDWVKTGRSRSIIPSLFTAQTFHVERLEIVGYVKFSSDEDSKFYERKMHRKYKGHRVGHGKEIFDGCIIDELLQDMKQP